MKVNAEIKVGDWTMVVTKSGKSIELPVVAIVGGRIVLDDGKTRLQIDRITGEILVLKGILS